jgi:putative endonuclease
MTNRRNGTLYTGVTGNLKQRVWQHRNGTYPHGFTKKYDCHLLAFYRDFPRIEDAIAEEKRIKSGSRRDKIKLIEEMNPEWKDLWETIKDWD